MSWQPCPDAQSNAAAPTGAVDVVILPRAHDVGGFDVRRALPSARRRVVGPFIFLDQMGPTELLVGQGLDVRPHPHIGLATITYLFDGAITHRDSLGTDIVIRPGEVNWMTAGRGIAHSERSPADQRTGGGRLFGMQSWVALPTAAEETEASFVHYGTEALPEIDADGAQVRLVAGSFLGATSPVATASELVYADIALAPGQRLPVTPEHEERALYIVSGRIAIAGEGYDAGALLVLRPGETAVVAAEADARLLLVGGTAFPEPRYIWWNFVSSSKERIDQAKADWQAGR
ncbi:MAG: pirin family protein, partial [Rhodospirillaceae bacterium]|nr:pirin family protein [Rhodospirillaceae bacterium]